MESRSRVGNTIYDIRSTTWESVSARRKGFSSPADRETESGGAAEKRSFWRLRWGEVRSCSAASSDSYLTSPSLRKLSLPASSGAGWLAAGEIPRSSPMSPSSAYKERIQRLNEQRLLASASVGRNPHDSKDNKLWLRLNWAEKLNKLNWTNLLPVL